MTKETTSRDLKPCEACGSAGGIEYHCGTYRGECSNEENCGHQTPMFWTEAEAIAAWNARPTEQPHDVVEAVYKAICCQGECRKLAEGTCAAHAFEKEAKAALAALASLSTQPKADEGLDSKRLDWLQSESSDVRWYSDGDDGIVLEIVGHWQAEPCERLLAINSGEDLRAAIDEAMTGQVLEQPPTTPKKPLTALRNDTPKADDTTMELLRELKKDLRCWVPQTLQQENVKAEALDRIDAHIKGASNV